MALKILVVLFKTLGDDSYIRHGNAIIVKSTLRQIDSLDWLVQNPHQSEHSWVEADIEDLKKTMGDVFAGKDLKAMKETARKEALRHDWKRIAMKVMKEIKKYG